MMTEEGELRKHEKVSPPSKCLHLFRNNCRLKLGFILLVATCLLTVSVSSFFGQHQVVTDTKEQDSRSSNTRLLSLGSPTRRSSSALKHGNLDSRSQSGRKNYFPENEDPSKAGQIHGKRDKVNVGDGRENTKESVSRTLSRKCINTNTTNCLETDSSSRMRINPETAASLETAAGTPSLVSNSTDSTTRSAETVPGPASRMSRGTNATTTPKNNDHPSEEKQHVFFLKVHKAGSTTVMNIMYRFAISRRLNVMLPKKGCSLSQTNKNWINSSLPLPPGVSRFDILCNHLVFDEESVRASLYPDAVYIGIIRNPFDQFISAFYYYRYRFSVHYLKQIPGKDPVSTYLNDPEKWETPNTHHSFTHNRMSFDFGLEPMKMNDTEYVAKYVAYLHKTFDLVLVSDKFDKSMILMRRVLGWQLQDVIYIRNNAFSHEEHTFTEKQRQAHRRFNMADYALYEHFSRLLDKKFAAEGRSLDEEVKAFRSVRKRVEDFCKRRRTETLTVPASVWNKQFSVSLLDCWYMTLPEKYLVRKVRGY